MEKRLVLAIALSIFIVVTFQYLFVKPSMQRIPAKESPPIKTDILQKEPSPPPLLEKTFVSSKESEFNIETGKYLLTFSNMGGALKRIVLKDYKKAGSNELLCLAEIQDPARYIFAMNDPMNTFLLDRSIYELKQKEGAIAYSLRLGDIEIIKEFVFPNSKYDIELRILIKNISPTEKALTYRLIGGAGINEEGIQNARFIEVASKIDDRVVNFKRPRNGRIINPGRVEWTSLKNKYFSMVLKPFIETKAQFYNLEKDGSFTTGVETKEVILPPASFVEHKFALYAGPTQISTMKEFGYEINESINYGFFGSISKALLAVLRFFHRVINNWGISIVLLSIFLNIILFPLTMKSFSSMQKMQALHPQMEKLKVQYKDNPQKLNKEILELYKKYKINPFSGCLPMVLQMPIFIALYNGLIRSIELKGANFLWIRDLSIPDAVKIPFALPLLGDHINILPIVMIIAMVVQQKISTRSMGGAVTEEQKQQQRIMLIIMPVMFGFIFYNMPSGLVLYWVVNTILTVIEQSILFKK